MFPFWAMRTSKDGMHIDERLDEPVYKPWESFERVNPKNKKTNFHTIMFPVGDTEDVKTLELPRIDDRYYLTYVAFDGYNPPRLPLPQLPLMIFLTGVSCGSVLSLFLHPGLWTRARLFPWENKRQIRDHAQDLSRHLGWFRWQSGFWRNGMA